MRLTLYGTTELARPMRMSFEPDEDEAYRAGAALLLDRLRRWSADQGASVDPFAVECLLDYRHGATRDGRLGLWEPRHVEEVLLEWMPRTVTLVPGRESDAPGSLRILLRYLDAVELADPRSAPLAETLAAVDAAALRHAEAMADSSRWGLAKFWTMAAVEHGVDVQDPAAVQEFVERARTGEVDYDRAALEVVVGNHFTSSPVERADPQLPVRLPDEAALRNQAARTELLDQLQGLVSWAGREGRVVTSKGRLRLADARQLVAELGTGDETEGVRSSAELPRLGLLVEWAKAARLVRVVKDRLCSVAKARPVMRDPLALWERLFDTLFTLRTPLIGARDGGYVPSVLWETYHVVLPDLMATLYALPCPMPWPQLRESVRLSYRDDSPLGGLITTYRDVEDADRDLRRVLQVLDDLGALTRHRGRADPLFLELPMPAGPEAGSSGSDDGSRTLHTELASGPVELMSLTDLGTYAMRRRLLAEGRDVPVVGELVDADAAGLLGVLAQSYDPDSARAELADWTAAHGGKEVAVEQLTAAVARTPFRIRASALLDTLVTALPGEEGEHLLHTLRTDSRLSPSALSVLAHREVLDPSSLTREESAVMVAESLLQLLETAGPDGAADALRAQPEEAEGALAAALASPHPDRDGLAELAALRNSVAPG